MTDRVANQELLEAGLSMMRANGIPLHKVPTSTRAMKYKTDKGETVRVRTCNDHVLVVLAESADAGATLNIEGTDHLLIVMPEVPRQPGSVISYFVPTDVAVQAVREAHAAWLLSNPSTKGNNRTWNIWFGDSQKSGGFAQKWSKYRINGECSTAGSGLSKRAVDDRTLGAVIAEARGAIAKAAGVPMAAVKITVALD